MKKLLFMLPLLALVFAACSSDDDDIDDVWEKYADWREVNDQWIEDQAELTNPDGSKVYTKVVPEWNKNAYVLMRWHNDTTQTQNNLRPLYTSTVDVKYIGRLYDDQPFDSSYVRTEPADSIYRCRVSSNITGWVIAMERMHVGDSVTVLIPYTVGYGSKSQGSYIKPYSTLQFGIKLVDIPGEYIRP